MIITLGGLIFGIVNIVGNFGTVFCDQAYWQSSVAAKPLQVSYILILNTLPVTSLLRTLAPKLTNLLGS